MFPSLPSSPSSISSGGYAASRSRSRSLSGDEDDDAFQPKRLRAQALPSSASSGSSGPSGSSASPGEWAADPPTESPASLVAQVSLTPSSPGSGSFDPLGALPSLALVPAFTPLDDESSIHSAESVEEEAPAEPVALFHGPADHEHEEAVDVFVDEERVVIRACFVARDMDLGDHMNATLTCGPADGFSGLYATDIGGDLVLIVLPPEGMHGLAYLRHTAARGAELTGIARQMTDAYAEEAGVPGRFAVAYATSPLWDDLNAYRLERQAAGETLDELVDGLIQAHALDLPLAAPALDVPGSPPAMPAGERLRQVGEAMAQRHAAYANLLATTFGGEAIALTQPAVYASWDGVILDFQQAPDHAFVDAQAAALMAQLAEAGPAHMAPATMLG